MIHFTCRCSEPFDVPDELAGTSLQCPKCGLLVDVPSLDDVPGLGEDGSYRLIDSPDDWTAGRVTNPGRRATGSGADTPHITTRGDATDRRLSLSEFLKVGVPEDELLELRDEVRPGVPKHPKYDPVTGELIVPLDVRPDPEKEVVAIPVAAGPAVLSYERASADRAPSIWSPFLAMFALPNLIVCGIVLVVHYVNMVTLGALISLFFPIVLVLPVLLLTIAHFANVVDETGPTGIDEMPRPMRGGSFYEDFLRPLIQVAFAYAMAWFPVWLIDRFVTELPPIANLALLGGFFMLVPAFLITVITSGAINNLLPHRALSVIPVAGARYWVTSVVGLVATVIFFLGTLMAISTGDNFNRLAFVPVGMPAPPKVTVFGIPTLLEMLLAPFVLAVGVYLVHVFCWQMGLIYRAHHDKFGWVLQKHDKTVRTDTLAQLHVHRQKQIEARMSRAKQQMQQRGAAGPMPVAKPVKQNK